MHPYKAGLSLLICILFVILGARPEPVTVVLAASSEWESQEDVHSRHPTEQGGTIPPSSPISDQAVHTGRLIIEFVQDFSPHLSTLDQLSTAGDLLAIDFASAESMETLGGWVLADLATTDADAVERAAARLSMLPFVRVATPEISVPHVELLQSFPNDPEFIEQWALNNTGQTLGNNITPLEGVDINAPEGWAIVNSAPSVTVTLMDTGIEYTHEDLAANVWVNSGEIPGNNIDDDLNGYIDDVRGWDFGDDDNDPIDISGHGTGVAGVAGAVGNNGIGVAGVAWSVQLMPVKIFADAGGFSNGGVIDAISYATNKGATISNHSWGISRETLLDAGLTDAQTESFIDSICTAMGAASTHLFVVAAGNDSSVNNDSDTQKALYPATCPQSNVIAVTGINTNDLLSGNYGPTTVDLAAPGTSIRTTWLNDQYTYYGGTSTAAPFVAGAAALVKQQNPAYTASDIKAELMNVRPVTDLTGDVLSNGALELNALPSLPVTLGYFFAERHGSDTSFVWKTVTEIASAGFDILAETPEGLSRLNSTLIVSQAVDSLEPLTYEYATTSDALRFYLQEVSIDGVVDRRGPFDIGIAYGALADGSEQSTGTSGEAMNHVYLPLIQ